MGRARVLWYNYLRMLNLYNINNHNGSTTAPPTNQAKKKVNIAKYEDPTNEFGAKEFKYGTWYIKHRLILYKTLIGFLIGISAIFWLFSLWKWGVYILDYNKTQQLQQSLSGSVNYTGIHSHFSAQPLQVISSQVLPSGQNKYAAMAQVINPNGRFLIFFDYYFVVGGQNTPVQKTFLLPGESRPLSYLGVENAGGADLILENITWQRISAHDVVNTKDWQAYRLNFAVSDFVFLKSLAQEGNNADAVQFKLTNNSPYSYVNPDFYVVLSSSGGMVGILPLHLDSIKSLETKSIDLRSLAPGLYVSDIAVYPIINVYDSSAYLSP